MARFARVVAVGVPHHVTQRGNGRQIILRNDADRITYLALLRQYSFLHNLSVLGYYLMSNHIHLIAVPETPDALAQALKHKHGGAGPPLPYTLVMPHPYRSTLER